MLLHAIIVNMYSILDINISNHKGKVEGQLCLSLGTARPSRFELHRLLHQGREDGMLAQRAQGARATCSQ